MCKSDQSSLDGPKVDELRRRLWENIEHGKQTGDFETLFTKGACHMFAQVLHWRLQLPLYYSSDGYGDNFAHVFVNSESGYYDYKGKRTLKDLEILTGNPDPNPHHVDAVSFGKWIKEKGKILGQSLEDCIFEIACSEFRRKRVRYPQSAQSTEPFASSE
jgi:hypothetical protein